MDINHLHYLVDVAETKSITHSAKRLFISQQRLSQIIQRMETELKVPLLHRHRQGVTLTEAGVVMVEKAQEIIEKYDELWRAVRPYAQVHAGNLSGQLVIGIVPFLGLNLLPEVLGLFHKQYPAVQVQIHEKQPEEIMCEVQKGDMDIGLVILPEYWLEDKIPNCDGTFEKVFEDEMLAVVAKQSPLAQKKIISVKDLQLYPVAFYNFGAYVDTIGQMFPNLNLRVAVRANSVDLFKNAIVNHGAVGITSTMDIKLLNDTALVTVPLHESIKLHYGCFTRNHVSPAIEKFVDILKFYIACKLNYKK